MENGWIKIERSILGHWIFQDADYFRAWIYLIAMANYEDKIILVDKKPKLIKRGSFFTSISELSRDLGWDRRKTKRFIENLKMCGMLSVDGTTHGTTLSLVKYEFYQGGGTADGTANGTVDGTADGTADGTQRKKDKNEKKEKNNARARVKQNSFFNFPQRGTDYDAMVAEPSGKKASSIAELEARDRAFRERRATR